MFIAFLVSASLLAQAHSIWIMILMLLMDAAKAISALCWLGYFISTFDQEETIETHSPRSRCCGYILPTWTGLRHSFRAIHEITAKAEAETDLNKCLDNMSEKDPWQQKAAGIASNLLSKKVQMSGLDEKGRKSAESSNFKCFLGDVSDVSTCFQHVASEMARCAAAQEVRRLNFLSRGLEYFAVVEICETFVPLVYMSLGRVLDGQVGQWFVSRMPEL